MNVLAKDSALKEMNVEWCMQNTLSKSVLATWKCSSFTLLLLLHLKVPIQIKNKNKRWFSTHIKYSHCLISK
jgi:hypothetical protein